MYSLILGSLLLLAIAVGVIADWRILRLWESLVGVLGFMLIASLLCVAMVLIIDGLGAVL